MKPTHQQAYELSKFKWEKIIALLQDTSQSVEKIYEEVCELEKLSSLRAGCGYCELYNNFSGVCPGCPLVVDGLTCADSGHPYDDFTSCNDHETALVAAIEVLDLIEKTKYHEHNP